MPGLIGCQASMSDSDTPLFKVEDHVSLKDRAGSGMVRIVGATCFRLHNERQRSVDIDGFDFCSRPPVSTAAETWR